MSEREKLERAAKELAHELRISLPTGMSTDVLRAKVSQMKKQKAEAPEVAKREEAIVDKARAKKIAILNATADELSGNAPEYDYQVAPGKTVKCRGGVLRPGACVLPVLVGGQEQLDALVQSGAVTARSGRMRALEYPKPEPKNSGAPSRVR